MAATQSSTQKKIETLEREILDTQLMIDNARVFAEQTGIMTPEFEMRLRIMQLDLDSKKLFVDFFKTAYGEL